MAAEQRKHADYNRKQNPKRNAPVGLSKEVSELSTFEKLILYLSKSHPDYSNSDFIDALYAYRQEQQTLAGLSLSQIEEGILDILRRKYPSRQHEVETTPNELADDKIEDSVAAALWSTFKRYREREQSSKRNNETVPAEDQCLICLENLSSKSTETFSCQHTFHRVCLEEWFKVERTCPLCRKMLLFADEFPALK